MPNQRDPVVKPSPKKPEVETKEDKPIVPQNTGKTVEEMPVTKTIEVTSENKDINAEGAVNPITYQSNFAALLNEGKKSDFTNGDYKNVKRWNELLKKREEKKSAFQVNEHFQVVKVIELKGVNREAKKILEDYKSEIENLNNDERIFFLTFEETRDDLLDPARCFIGLKIKILDRISADKFKIFPGVFAYDEGLCVIRANATTLKTSRQDNEAPK
ncbi:hypothetical protein KKB99_05830 [bacterium]|nr:hypothetical protein [bacterium]MBU1025510.1 hypothetical protein [bacterium]